MAINIHISGDSAGEAVKELAVLASFLTGPAAPQTADSAEGSKTDKPTRSRNAKLETQSAKTPEPEPETTDASPTESDDDAPIPTAIELRAKATEVGTDQSKKPKIKALLDQFGVPNITSIQEDKRRAFMAELEKL